MLRRSSSKGCARLSEGLPCLDPVSSIGSCTAVLFSIVVPSELASQLHLRGLCFGLDHLKGLSTLCEGLREAVERVPPQRKQRKQEGRGVPVVLRE